jgi:hypothetical protein
MRSVPQTAGTFVAMATSEPGFHGLSYAALGAHAAHVATTSGASVLE